jgi:phosphate-selective porin
VFNGVAESQNEVDRNDQKAAAGRLVARPVDGLHVGASGAWDPGGDDDRSPGGAGRPRRERWGGELQFARGPWLLRSEFIRGVDGPLRRRGFYGHVGYRFVPRVEGILRVDGWDPDTASESTRASVSELDYVLGLNVFFSQHNLKLQVNYLRKTFDTDIQPSRNVLLVNTQTFW